MHQRQHHQHENHHLKATGQLVQSLFDLLIDFLPLEAGEKVMRQTGKLRFTLRLQSGGFDS